MPSRLKFSLVLRFRDFGGVFTGAKGVKSIISVFKGLAVVPLRFLSVMLCADALTVDEGRTLSRGKRTPPLF